MLLYKIRLYCNHLGRASVRLHFRNRYLSFYWKKWFYIWYVTLAWWLVLCLPFPGLPHIYFLFTVRLTNERVGVFLARRSVQHLVGLVQSRHHHHFIKCNLFSSWYRWKIAHLALNINQSLTQSLLYMYI